MNATSTVRIPVLPAVGLSAATGGAFVLGTAGLIGGATAGGVTCVFAALSGVACPFCGLTHGVAALGAGDPGAALAANPLVPLAIGLAIAVPAALLRRHRLQASPAVLRALAALVIAVWLARVL